ncbi:hypothetical protein FRB90_001265, partial [Tulasnella sp. 427]
MPAAPQNIVNDATELLLAHIKPPRHDMQECQSSDLESVLFELDDEVDSMEKTLSMLNRYLNARIAQRKRERNDLVRFSRLPLEISGGILWLSVNDPWQGKTYLESVQAIALVCFAWRTLVQGSPRFWSIIELGTPLAAVKYCLKRAGSHPLEVRSMSSDSCSGPDVLTSDALSDDRYTRLVSKRVGQTRRLSVFMRDAVDGTIRWILEKPAPLLEELKLQFVHNVFARPVELFSGQAGKLKSVELDNIPIRWDSEALAGLTTLEIKGRSLYAPIEMQVTEMLRANTALESLCLEEVKVAERLEEALARQASNWIKPSTPVAMRKLRHLKLLNIPLELFLVVIDAVEIPCIETLELHCSFRFRPVFSLALITKSLTTPIFMLASKAERVELSFENDQVGLSIYLPSDNAPVVRFYMHNTMPRLGGFHWIVENLLSEFILPPDLDRLGPPVGLPLTLVFGDGFDLDHAVVPIVDELDAIPVQILELKIGALCINGGAVIQYLQERRGEDLHWPLPDLKSITLGGSSLLVVDLHNTLEKRVKPYKKASRSSAHGLLP